MNVEKKKLMVPLGKYGGQPIEVLAEDSKYTTWLLAQDWFRSQYPEHYTVIINNFAAPSETPEHNELQARFLDDTLCARVVTAIHQLPWYSAVKIENKRFEISGWDAFFHASWLTHSWTSGADYATGATRWIEIPGPSKLARNSHGHFWLELKPALGDDYPATIRQCRLPQHSDPQTATQVVVFDRFTVSNLPLQTVAAIFRASRIHLLQFDALPLLPTRPAA